MQPCIKVQYIALQPLLDPIYIHMLLDPIYTYNGIYIMSNISVSVRRSHIFQPGTYCFCLSVLVPVLLATVLDPVACTSVHSVAAVCSVACTSVACNSVHSVAAVCSVQCAVLLAPVLDPVHWTLCTV